MTTKEPTPQQTADLIKRIKNKGGCGCDGCDKSCRGVCGLNCGGICCCGGGGGGGQSQGHKPPSVEPPDDKPERERQRG